MKKRKILTGLALVALLLTSCGSKDQPAKKSAKEGTSEEMTRPLRVAMSTEIDSLDAFKIAAGDSKTVMDQVYDGLFDVGEDGSLVGDLCESYEVSEDGLVYDFKLKKDVKFHDGSDFTAEDVYYTYDKLAGFSSKDASNSKFAGIKDIEIVNDHEIKMTLKERDNSFLFLNTHPIVKKDYTDNGTFPIGTGPFKFVSYLPGEGLKLTRNDDYHNKDHIAKFKDVEIIRVADRQALVMALNNKDVDFAGLDADSLDGVKDSCDVYSSSQNLVQVMGLNNKVKPFDDIRVGQAINYAIDKDDIINTVSAGKAKKLSSSFSPALAEYYNDLEDPYPYNPDLAKKLLEEAGYKEGFDLKLTVPSDYKYHVDTAELISDQLKKVGINITIDPIEFSTWLTRVYKDRDYTATIVGFIGYIDPIRILDRYESTSEKDYINYVSDEYDGAIRAAKSAKDKESLIENVKKAQEIIAKDAASVFIADPDNNQVLNNDLDGVKSYPVQKWNLEDIGMKK